MTERELLEALRHDVTLKIEVCITEAKPEHVAYVEKTFAVLASLDEKPPLTLENIIHCIKRIYAEYPEALTEGAGYTAKTANAYASIQAAVATYRAGAAKLDRTPSPVTASMDALTGGAGGSGASAETTPAGDGAAAAVSGGAGGSGVSAETTPAGGAGSSPRLFSTPATKLNHREYADKIVADVNRTIREVDAALANNNIGLASEKRGALDRFATEAGLYYIKNKSALNDDMQLDILAAWKSARDAVNAYDEQAGKKLSKDAKEDSKSVQTRLSGVRRLVFEKALDEKRDDRVRLNDSGSDYRRRLLRAEMLYMRTRAKGDYCKHPYRGAFARARAGMEVAEWMSAKGDEAVAKIIVNDEFHSLLAQVSSGMFKGKGKLSTDLSGTYMREMGYLARQDDIEGFEFYFMRSAMRSDMRIDAVTFEAEDEHRVEKAAMLIRHQDRRAICNWLKDVAEGKPFPITLADGTVHQQTINANGLMQKLTQVSLALSNIPAPELKGRTVLEIINPLLQVKRRYITDKGLKSCLGAAEQDQQEALVSFGLHAFIDTHAKGLRPSKAADSGNVASRSHGRK